MIRTEEKKKTGIISKRPPMHEVTRHNQAFQIKFNLEGQRSLSKKLYILIRNFTIQLLAIMTIINFSLFHSNIQKMKSIEELHSKKLIQGNDYLGIIGD